MRALLQPPPPPATTMKTTTRTALAAAAEALAAAHAPRLLRELEAAGWWVGTPLLEEQSPPGGQPRRVRALWTNCGGPIASWWARAAGREPKRAAPLWFERLGRASHVRLQHARGDGSHARHAERSVTTVRLRVGLRI